MIDRPEDAATEKPVFHSQVPEEGGQQATQCYMEGLWVMRDGGDGGEQPLSLYCGFQGSNRGKGSEFRIDELV